MCDMYRKACFSENLFTNGLNIVLPSQVDVKNTIYEVETHRLSSKVKVPDLAISKEGHAESRLGLERTHSIISLEKGATVNIVSDNQLRW